MSMVSSELKTTFVVDFFKKGSILSYPMIIAKVFESAFEFCDADVKLKVLND
jgi:hypothetical protein